MIVTKGYGSGRFPSIAIKGLGRWFNRHYKTVSESIGVSERRLVASQTSFDGQWQSILTFILSDEYEDIKKVETVWKEHKVLETKY